MESIPTKEMGKPRRWWIRLCQWLWEKRRFFWITFFFSLSLNLFAAWLYTPWSTDFKKLPIGWVFQNPLIMLLIGICLLLLTGIVGLVSHLDRTLSFPYPQPQPNIQNRHWLLARVHAFWIEGVLEQSLHGITLVELQLSEQQGVILNPWRLVIQEIDQTTRSLPVGTSILQIYDHRDGELLILGEPGSGKTTLLLQLTRDLLDRAKQDDTCPIPVIFNLSSWAIKQQPFTDWLVEELHMKYQVPYRLCQLYVHGNHILPLLDGLDEVISSSRMNCVQAINTYRREHGIVPTVVCSRSAEYFALEERLLLLTAVIIQPLTKQQIDEYLASASTSLESVREALREDPVLQELVTTPLMLNVFVLAYHGSSVEDILVTDYSGSRRQQVFAAYVQRVLQRREVETHYIAKRTEYWLAWLAWQMMQHNQTEYHYEQMELAWYSNILSDWSNSMTTLLIMVEVLLLYGLSHHMLIDRVVVSFLGLSMTFLIFSMREIVETKLNAAKVKVLLWIRSLKWNPRKVSGNKLIYSFLIGLLVGLIIGIPNGPQIGFVMGLAAVLFYGTAIYIHRGVLRFLLWHAGSTPWNYSRFLDYAVQRILLRKVGGGYIFIHRLLLEYFATLYPAKLHPDPTDARTYFRRGTAYRELKQYQRAIQDFDRAIDLDPNYARAYLGRGIAYRELEQHQRAIEDFDRAIDLDPKDGWVYRERGIAYNGLEQYQRAIEDFDRTIDLKPSNPWAYRDRGITYNGLKQHQRAIEDFDRAIDLDPKDGWAYVARGIAYRELEQYQRAIEDFDRAIDLDPSNPWAYRERGIAYRKLEQHQRAIEDFDRAIDLDPNYVRAYLGRGVAYRELEQYQRAIEDFDRAIDLKPSNPWAYRERGIAHRELEQYQRAIEDFDRAIDLDPNYAWAYNDRGLTHLYLKNTQQAMSDYNHSYELAPTNNDAAWMSTWIDMEKQRADIGAAEHLELIAAIKPEGYITLVCRGIALGLRGNLKDGLRELEKAILLEPEKFDAYFWKGMLCAYYYQGQNQVKVVKASIEQALESGLPPILLVPLYWLERDRPHMFIIYAKSKLEEFQVL